MTPFNFTQSLSEIGFVTQNSINKDLEVSASPTPKVCPQCNCNVGKNGHPFTAWFNVYNCCPDCGWLGKPSLNPDIK